MSLCLKVNTPRSVGLLALGDHIRVQNPQQNRAALASRIKQRSSCANLSQFADSPRIAQNVQNIFNYFVFLLLPLLIEFVNNQAHTIHLFSELFEPFDSVGVLPTAPNHIVAIDPGVRTFRTLFDPTNQQYIEWGGNDMGHIYRLAHHMDDLQSRMCSTPEKPVRHH